MAGRPKTSASENENENINSKSDSDLKNENINLKAQLDEVMKIIDELKNKPSSTVESNTDLIMTKRVTITSLSAGGVNLRTSVEGNAKRFRLEGIGQTIPIIYEDLINCINSDRWIFENGVVYINDKKAVEENYLEDYYKRFLDINAITHILDFESETITEMLTNTTDEIKESICTLIANKINKNERIDMNKLDTVEKICGINIKDMAKRLK